MFWPRWNGTSRKEGAHHGNPEAWRPRAFGTSPDRYRTLRRVALARAAIESGQSLAGAAAEAGFADQSHMTRQFKRTYGLTPGPLDGSHSRSRLTHDHPVRLACDRVRPRA